MHRYGAVRQQYPHKENALGRSRVLKCLILLCFDFRAVPEGDRDYLAPANRYILNRAAPKSYVKFADNAFLCFHQGDELSQPHTLCFFRYNGFCHRIVPCLGFIVPVYKTVVASWKQSSKAHPPDAAFLSVRHPLRTAFCGQAPHWR